MDNVAVVIDRLDYADGKCPTRFRDPSQGGAMKLSAIVSLLIAANASKEVILEAIVSWEKSNDVAITVAREKANARWNKWKAKNAELQTNVVGMPVTGATRVEDNLLTKEISGQKKKESKKDTPSTMAVVRSELLSVLDEDHTDSLIEHRKSLKHPLTKRAACLLAKELSKCADPNVGVDAMIANGWRGFEAAWLRNKGSGRAPPSNVNPETGWVQGSAFDAAQSLINDLENGHGPQQNGQRDVRETRRDVRRLPAIEDDGRPEPDPAFHFGNEGRRH